MRSIYMAVMGLVFSTAVTAQPVRTSASVSKYLVTAEAKLSMTAAELKDSYGNLAAFVKNGYTAYRITYNTKTPQGKAVVASGAVFVPDTKTSMPFLNYNHGTIFPAQERTAPSYLQPANAELGIAKLFAANGYLVAVPDYIGYGSTKNETHPYGAYHIIANSVTDMLQATKEFCAEKKILLSGKNFFSGWSEGAAVALATVKKLEEEKNESFKPTAAVLNAGPYYSSAFVDHILDAEESLRYMPSYVWVLRTYNVLYNINKPLNYYFTQPAARRLEQDGEANITHDPSELFTPAFKASYKAGKDSALLSAMQANDLWSWKPQSRVVFCHGDKDEYVPIFNSEKAYSEMKAKGADVSFNVFKGQTHASGVFSFLNAAFSEFEKKR